ncbi:hypothetical protein EUGRSUZ_F02011 [Eucalyptus grandis]|uniref:Uncharacterized protein n=2 Tax=Eucalyptus grandis TaxID=71139 RepID=A0ACC3KGU2_EUCGR|nr:hypothetical protein EUGRSUZ_F02011 [Eucalyptus grandis]
MEAKHIKHYRNFHRILHVGEDRGLWGLHEVNAHTMSKHPILRRKSFDRIVYNFPHAGFYGPEESLLQIELHRDLVRGLKNAKTMLTEDGVIHVTHKTAHPYSKWEIEKLAEEQGLFLVEKVRFSVRDYKGYVNRRGKCWMQIAQPQISIIKTRTCIIE